ncbi:structure-specific endonuclease subunit SLX1 [Ornithorhynchus anatinus]|uniref:SLX1 homolog A, structure-specific endonuclease subunit n=1 Tax=Ornithorhynchus anatinus TaxID=9258 RepID=F6S2J0_ORNAN|nr:structure-specific endonuclease subunit SLX1 [Ornithorhynchus anatinus]
MGPAPGPFFGVYLLYCLNPKHRGRVYVGFTVNPRRRAQQHNAGRKKGGAWRTSGRGPWEMVLIVHGFPSSVAALRFEWAWQHPGASRRLGHVAGRGRREAAFPFHLRVLAQMLQVAPWSRLPLTLRWLRQDFQRDLTPPPPPHVPLAFGPPQPGPAGKSKGMAAGAGAGAYCSLCLRPVEDEDGPLRCPHSTCPFRAHLLCLAQDFLQGQPQQLLPLEGCCPGCKNQLLWGDLIQLHRAGRRSPEEEEEEEELSPVEGHWTDGLKT